jgi:DNA replication and repair protein RecF
MAELRFMEEIRGDKPVLLLDDVLSELDENRQGYLINGLKGIQTIVTTTECDHIKKLLGSREMAGFSVNTGRVERVY